MLVLQDVIILDCLIILLEVSHNDASILSAGHRYPFAIDNCYMDSKCWKSSFVGMLLMCKLCNKYKNHIILYLIFKYHEVKTHA